MHVFMIAMQKYFEEIKDFFFPIETTTIDKNLDTCFTCEN